MKNFIFHNQQAICKALYLFEHANEEVNEELYGLADEISCIGKDIDQLLYVIDEIVYLHPLAKKALCSVIAVLKAVI